MKRTLLSLACVVLGASACASAHAGSDPTRAATSVGGSASHQPAATATLAPTRILSLSASATQMLYAIGAGNQVIGVDKYSTWPPAAPRTKFTGFENSVEGYATMHPDLIVLASASAPVAAGLRKIGIRSIVLPAATTLAEAEAQITKLGRATGHEAAAQSVNATVEADLARDVAAAARHGVGASYYVEIDPTYYSANSATFIGSLMSRFGMRSIADGAKQPNSGYPQLSAEYVLSANPDFVFLADTVCCGQSVASFVSRPGFALMKAVRTKHVVAVNDSTASEWGPHSIEAFAAQIAKTLNAAHS